MNSEIVLNCIRSHVVDDKVSIHIIEDIFRNAATLPTPSHSGDWCDVRLPTDIKTARAYAILGTNWLEEHSPKDLRHIGWLHIDDRAKKEARVDLWFSNGKDGYRVTNCYWHKKANRWQGGDQEFRVGYTPTHWQPLPTPPNAEGE